MSNLENLFELADNEAMKEYKRIIKKTFKENPKYTSFCSGMGSYFFSDKKGNNDLPCKELDDFINDWDNIFKLSGMDLDLFPEIDPIKDTGEFFCENFVLAKWDTIEKDWRVKITTEGVRTSHSFRGLGLSSNSTQKFFKDEMKVLYPQHRIIFVK